ncbi:hypothetical protein XFF6166_870009 [Xanthomonas citri pv. fuscans]|nr:hypothetical protein XFF6166_870009 [Xanthomonas citri pv. fuscans]SOO06116.1 hypothetical protein XFF7767_640018 [Xanthomonas citri pv. fuscans]SOO10174.1 hypothetical protein XFF6970_500033 [Xanthomonas citri pv. fuscans]SOO15746.1 hypothetical protein XFF7766_620018 [Xanthomonas citri pv. fuscans]SOO42566.1 hypothetical protein XFF1815_220018 [Xanthomonas citri pv. fuscans]
MRVRSKPEVVQLHECFARTLTPPALPWGEGSGLLLIERLRLRCAQRAPDPEIADDEGQRHRGGVPQQQLAQHRRSLQDVHVVTAIQQRDGVR